MLLLRHAYLPFPGGAAAPDFLLLYRVKCVKRSPAGELCRNLLAGQFHHAFQQQPRPAFNVGPVGPFVGRMRYTQPQNSTATAFNLLLSLFASDARTGWPASIFLSVL